jgi:hypothetical protein
MTVFGVADGCHLLVCGIYVKAHFRIAAHVFQGYLL